MSIISCQTVFSTESSWQYFLKDDILHEIHRWTFFINFENLEVVRWLNTGHCNIKLTWNLIDLEVIVCLWIAKCHMLTHHVKKSQYCSSKSQQFLEFDPGSYLMSWQNKGELETVFFQTLKARMDLRGEKLFLVSWESFQSFSQDLLLILHRWHGESISLWCI